MRQRRSARCQTELSRAVTLRAASDGATEHRLGLALRRQKASALARVPAAPAMRAPAMR